MFPKIVSQWDVWLSNLPCRWQSAPKDKKEKLYLREEKVVVGTVYTTCI